MLAVASVGPVTNDLGMNAWVTAVPSNGAYAIYSQGLSADQSASLSNQDWVLSLTLRVVGFDPIGYSGVSLNTGTDQFGIAFGSETDGDPFVQIGHQSYILTGAGSTYNNYQLVYDATSDTANLYVDGVKRLSDVEHASFQDSGGLLEFGSGAQAGPAQANWNSISITIPEPSSAGIFLLGSGALFYFRRKQMNLTRQPLEEPCQQKRLGEKTNAGLASRLPNQVKAQPTQTKPPNRLPASCGCLSQPSAASEFFTLTTRFVFDNGGDHPDYEHFRIGISSFPVKSIVRPQVS